MSLPKPDGRLIRKERKRQGLTREALVGKMKQISPAEETAGRGPYADAVATLRRIERNEMVPDARILLLISLALDVPQVQFYPEDEREAYLAEREESADESAAPSAKTLQLIARALAIQPMRPSPEDWQEAFLPDRDESADESADADSLVAAIRRWRAENQALSSGNEAPSSTVEYVYRWSAFHDTLKESIKERSDIEEKAFRIIARVLAKRPA